jgi:hypothetical protein
MKAIIEVEFSFDGEQPKKETIESALFSLIKASVVMSEEIDGTDDWAMLIDSTSVSVTENEN